MNFLLGTWFRYSTTWLVFILFIFKYILKKIEKDAWTIDYKELVIEKELGRGAFGKKK